MAHFMARLYIRLQTPGMKTFRLQARRENSRNSTNLATSTSNISVYLGCDNLVPGVFTTFRFVSQRFSGTTLGFLFPALLWSSRCLNVFETHVPRLSEWGAIWSGMAISCCPHANQKHPKSVNLSRSQSVWRRIAAPALPILFRPLRLWFPQWASLVSPELKMKRYKKQEMILSKSNHM